MMGTLKLNGLYDPVFLHPHFFTSVEFKNKTEQSTNCFSEDKQAAQ